MDRPILRIVVIGWNHVIRVWKGIWNNGITHIFDCDHDRLFRCLWYNHICTSSIRSSFGSRSSNSTVLLLRHYRRRHDIQTEITTLFSSGGGHRGGG